MPVHRLMEVRRDGQPPRFYIDSKQVSRDTFEHYESRASALFGFGKAMKYGAVRNYKLVRIGDHPAPSGPVSRAAGMDIG